MMSPIFLAVPLMKPLMLCFNQPVASVISDIVAPSFRERSSRTTCFLLPSRGSRSFLASAGLAAGLLAGFASFLGAALASFLDALLAVFLAAGLGAFLPAAFGALWSATVASAVSLAFIGLVVLSALDPRM